MRRRREIFGEMEAKMAKFVAQSWPGTVIMEAKIPPLHTCDSPLQATVRTDEQQELMASTAGSEERQLQTAQAPGNTSVQVAMLESHQAWPQLTVLHGAAHIDRTDE